MKISHTVNGRINKHFLKVDTLVLDGQESEVYVLVSGSGPIITPY